MRYLILFIMPLAFVYCSPRSMTNQGEETKELSRAERDSIKTENYQIISEFVKDSSFVMEAYQATDRYLNTFPVAGPNMIMMNDEKIYVQTSNPSGIGSQNLKSIRRIKRRG